MNNSNDNIFNKDNIKHLVKALYSKHKNNILSAIFLFALLIITSTISKIYDLRADTEQVFSLTVSIASFYLFILFLMLIVYGLSFIPFLIDNGAVDSKYAKSTKREFKRLKGRFKAISKRIKFNKRFNYYVFSVISFNIILHFIRILVIKDEITMSHEIYTEIQDFFFLISTVLLMYSILPFILVFTTYGIKDIEKKFLTKYVLIFIVISLLSSYDFEYYFLNFITGIAVISFWVFSLFFLINIISYDFIFHASEKVLRFANRNDIELSETIMKAIEFSRKSKWIIFENELDLSEMWCFYKIIAFNEIVEEGNMNIYLFLHAIFSSSITDDPQSNESNIKSFHKNYQHLCERKEKLCGDIKDKKDNTLSHFIK